MGRIYEDRQTLPDLRWFWSITIYVNPKQGINTSGRAASLEGAKAQFLSNWQKCRAGSTPYRPLFERGFTLNSTPSGRTSSSRHIEPQSAWWHSRSPDGRREVDRRLGHIGHVDAVLRECDLKS